MTENNRNSRSGLKNKKANTTHTYITPISQQYYFDLCRYLVQNTRLPQRYLLQNADGKAFLQEEKKSHD